MLTIYRTLTVALIIDTLALITVLTLGHGGLGIMLAILAGVIIIALATIIKCNNCGTRPGLWILAFWTLFLDYELYLIDTLMLRKCPKCEEPIK